jgi:hypothetical protein
MADTRFGHRHASKLFVVGTLSLLSACGPSEERQTFSAETDEELEQVLAMVRPGDVLTRGDITLVVPPEGEAVHMEALYRDGRSEELNVVTGTDGKVALVRNTPSVQAADYRAMGACSDGAYTLSGFKWRETYRWYFNSGSTPGEITVSGAEDKLRAAASNVTGGQNDCGLTDAISASHSYQGRTSRSVDCGDASRDGVNVVGFGDLSAGTLAVACTRYNPDTNTAGESDIRFNKVDHTWTLHSEDPSCSNRYGLEAVATHEFGHVFGLGHVSEADHPYLTMSTNVAPCNSSAATLGLGDVRGMRALY